MSKEYPEEWSETGEPLTIEFMKTNFDPLHHYLKREIHRLYEKYQLDHGNLKFGFWCRDCTVFQTVCDPCYDARSYEMDRTVQILKMAKIH